MAATSAVPTDDAIDLACVEGNNVLKEVVTALMHLLLDPQLVLRRDLARTCVMECATKDLCDGRQSLHTDVAAQTHGAHESCFVLHVKPELGLHGRRQHVDHMMSHLLQRDACRLW